MSDKLNVSASSARSAVASVAGYAVLRDARRAVPHKAETWPRISPAEARAISNALNEALDALSTLTPESPSK